MDKKEKSAAREKRLAEALRLNLRRRKEAGARLRQEEKKGDDGKNHKD